MASKVVLLCSSLNLFENSPLITQAFSFNLFRPLPQDLEWCIDKDFPKGTELTPLEREYEAHSAFAEARRRVYIGREEYFEEINKHMEEFTGVPLVVLGESGCVLYSNCVKTEIIVDFS